MFAYLPARIGSKRIKEKNIYKIDNTPLINFVITNLKKLDFLNDIFVSTDSVKICSIVSKLGVQTLELREKKLSNDSATFMDLIRNDIPRFIDYTKCYDVLFVLPTAILVPPEIFKDSFKKYKETKPEILMSTEKNSNPIWWAMEKKKKYLSPIFKDKVSINSQLLKPTFSDAGLFYYFDQRKIKKYKSHKNAKRIYPYLVPSNYTCDLNTTKDLEYLIYKYNLSK